MILIYDTYNNNINNNNNNIIIAFIDSFNSIVTVIKTLAMPDKIFAICKFPEENDKFSHVPLSWVTVNEEDEEKSQCRWPDIEDMKVARSFINDHTEPEDSWQTVTCKVLSYSNERDLEKKLKRAQFSSDLDSPVKT